MYTLPRVWTGEHSEKMSEAQKCGKKRHTSTFEKNEDVKKKNRHVCKNKDFLNFVLKCS